MSDGLILRTTVIADEVCTDDWTVIHDGQEIGRINRWVHVPEGRPSWHWSLMIGRPQTNDMRGLVETLNDAKVAFKTAWKQRNCNIS